MKFIFKVFYFCRIDRIIIAVVSKVLVILILNNLDKYKNRYKRKKYSRTKKPRLNI